MLKKIKIPETYALIFFLVVLASILTWFRSGGKV